MLQTDITVAALQVLHVSQPLAACLQLFFMVDLMINNTRGLPLNGRIQEPLTFLNRLLRVNWLKQIILFFTYAILNDIISLILYNIQVVYQVVYHIRLYIIQFVIFVVCIFEDTIYKGNTSVIHDSHFGVFLYRTRQF